MKKTLFTYILLTIILVTLCSCTHSIEPKENSAPTLQVTKVSATPSETMSASPSATPTPTETPVNLNISPNVVGIYIPKDDGTKDRILISEFTSAREPKTDIDCFEVLATNEGVASGNSFKKIWNDAWDLHENTENSKIGFHIELNFKDGTILSKTLLKPSDCDDFFEYLEIYMYDDVHQTGWYSHLTDGEMTDETVITSAKLHCGDKISDVGNIILTAFIYNGDECFDADGNYRGDVYATVKITETNS